MGGTLTSTLRAQFLTEMTVPEIPWTLSFTLIRPGMCIAYRPDQSRTHNHPFPNHRQEVHTWLLFNTILFPEPVTI